MRRRRAGYCTVGESVNFDVNSRKSGGCGALCGVAFVSGFQGFWDVVRH